METWRTARRISINNRELIIAAGDGKYDLLGYYLKEGADVNYQDRDGNTALHWAVENGKLEVIEVLLHNRATNLNNNENETPISLAKRFKKLDALKMLESTLDSNVNASKNKLQTAKVKHNENRVEPNTNIASVSEFINEIHYSNNLRNRENAQPRIEKMVGENIYQLKVLMLFLKRGLSRKYSFRLRPEIKKANKFDDLVFKYTEKDEKKVYRLLQAKHKLSESQKISAGSLLANNNGDYSLIKYFRSYEDCKQDIQFENGIIKDVTVCTNIDFDFKSLQSGGIKVQRIESSDDILDVKSKLKQSARYKFHKGLASLLTENLRSTSIDEIRDFLDHLVFAVNQPNEDELGVIIKQEIGKELDFVTTKNSYNKLFKRMLNWLQGKEGSKYLSYEEGEQFFKEAERSISVSFGIKNPVKSFIGRVKELDDLHIMLQDNSEMPRLVCICGEGGIGKTELARKYITLYDEYYDNQIIWINADCYTSLAGSFCRLASDKLNINTKDVNGNQKELRSIVEDIYNFFAKQRSLFVFDDAEKYESQQDFNGIEEFLPCLTSEARMLHVLITSRNKMWPKHFKVLNVNAFNESEGVDFLKNSLEMRDNTQMMERKDLAAKLDFMPLALQQAVSYINTRNANLRNAESQFTIQEYIYNTYQEKMKPYLKFNFSEYISYSSYTRTVFTTCNVILDTISRVENGNNAVDILNIVSYMAAEDIPTHFFIRLIPDPCKLGSAISILSQYSLINVENATFNIHRLVQQVIRMNIQEKNAESQILERALNLLTKDKITSNTISHAMSVWNHSQKYTNLLVQFSMFPCYVGRALLDNDRCTEAYLLGQASLETMSGLLMEDINFIYIILVIHQNIASAFTKLGKHDMALENLQHVLTNKELLQYDLTDILYTKTTIADILVKQAKCNDALVYYEQVYAYKTTLGLDFHVILRAKRGIAEVLVRKGKYAQGTQIFKEVLCMQKKKLGKSHWETIETKESLAKSLMEQDKLDESLNLLLEIYAASINTSSKTDCSMLPIMHNIGLVYFKKNYFTKALQWYNVVINVAETAGGKLHHSALIARARVADVLRIQGKHNEALDLCREAWEKLRDSLGPRHTNTITAQHILGLICDARGDYNKALELFQDVLYKRKLDFDNKHPDVLRTMKAIGDILIKQGKIDEAIQHIQQILDIEVEIHGENHLFTLATKTNLGILLRKHNNHLKALEVLQDTLNTIERFHSHHSLTNEVKENIGLVYYAEKKYDDALKILSDVLHARETVLGKSNLESVAIKETITVILLNQQKTTEALKLLSEMDAVNVLNVGARIQTASVLNNDLLIAVRNNDVVNAELLIKCGGDVNSTDNDGGSLLHYAVNNNNVRIVSLLLENGADIMQVTKKGNTPLHVAVSKDLLDIVEVLLQFSKRHELTAFVDVRTTASGSSALHVATKNGSLKIVKYLLRNGATYNIKDNEKNTPLMLSKNRTISDLLLLTEELFSDAKCDNVNMIHKLRHLSYDTLLAVTNARSEYKTITQVCIINNHKNIAPVVLQVIRNRRICYPIK